MEFDDCREELVELRRVLGDANKSFTEMAVQRKKRQAIIELRRAVVETAATFSRLNRQGASRSIFPVEFRFLSADDPGIFEGYGAVFNNLDDHGDVILPAAFKDTLADHQRRGVMPGLFAEHSYFNNGDPLPVGKWLNLYEDHYGLRGKGKLSGVSDTDHGKRLRALMLDGAMGGLSIAFSVPPGGATYTGSRIAGEPKRILKRVNLVSVDIVRSPSNPAALIDAVKSAGGK